MRGRRRSLSVVICVIDLSFNPVCRKSPRSPVIALLIIDYREEHYQILFALDRGNRLGHIVVSSRRKVKSSVGGVPKINISLPLLDGVQELRYLHVC